MANLTLEEIDEKITEYQRLRTELVRNSGRPILWDALKSAFDTLPEQIRNIYWVQGTPSWCDGDPCEFSIREIYFNRGDEDYDGDDDGFDAFTITFYLSDKDGEGPKHRYESDDRYQERLDRYARRRQEILDAGWTLEDASRIKEAEKVVTDWLTNHEDFMDELFGNATVIVYRDGRIEDDEAYLD